MTNECTEGRHGTYKLLLNRTAIAIGSLSLVDKELAAIYLELTELSNFAILTEQGEEKNSDSGFFITPPLEVYE